MTTKQEVDRFLKSNSYKMFLRHNPVINGFAQLNSENLAKVVDFVFMTIQQNTTQLDGICATYHKIGNTCPSFNMGSRRRGSMYIWKNKDYYYHSMMKILSSRSNRKEKEFKLLKLFVEIPNLGLSKSGFVVQLVAGMGGCFDSRNIKKWEIKKESISYSKSIKSEKIKDDKIRNYQECIKKCGGTRYLWDQWCYGVGKEYDYFKDGVEVSAGHVYWIMGVKVG